MKGERGEDLLELGQFAVFDETHPAYEPIYEAMRYTGGGPTAALEMVRVWWNKEEDGELPSYKTVERVAHKHRWKLKMLEEFAASTDSFDAFMNIMLKRNGFIAIQVQEQMLSGQMEARMVGPMSKVVRDALFFANIGAMANRFGKIDTQNPAVLKTITGLEDDDLVDFESIMERRRKEAGR